MTDSNYSYFINDKNFCNNWLDPNLLYTNNTLFLYKVKTHSMINKIQVYLTM